MNLPRMQHSKAVKEAALMSFILFQDGERCRFLAQESRTGDTQGVPARKVQAAEGKETVDTIPDVFYHHLNELRHLV